MKKILEYFKLKILVNKLMNRSNGLLTEEKVVHKINGKDYSFPKYKELTWK